jgi:hypothetical protein
MICVGARVLDLSLDWWSAEHAISARIAVGDAVNRPQYWTSRHSPAPGTSRMG